MFVQRLMEWKFLSTKHLFSMRDIRDILKESPVVFDVAFTESVTIENLYFLIRSTFDEVVIYDFGAYVKASGLLTIKETQHIKKLYPKIKIESYGIDSDLKNKVFNY